MSGHDDPEVLAVLRRHIEHRGEDAPIIQRVVPLMSGQAADVLVTAVVAGYPRMSGARLAHLCGTSVRTVESSVANAYLETVEDLLGLIASLHTVCWFDVLGWSLKRLLPPSGFSRKQPSRGYVMRQAGAGSARPVCGGRFAELLDGCASAMFPPGSTLLVTASQRMPRVAVPFCA